MCDFNICTQQSERWAHERPTQKFLPKGLFLPWVRRVPFCLLLRLFFVPDISIIKGYNNVRLGVLPPLLPNKKLFLVVCDITCEKDIQWEVVVFQSNEFQSGMALLQMTWCHTQGTMSNSLLMSCNIHPTGILG